MLTERSQMKKITSRMIPFMSSVLKRKSVERKADDEEGCRWERGAAANRHRGSCLCSASVILGAVGDSCTAL